MINSATDKFRSTVNTTELTKTQHSQQECMQCNSPPLLLDTACSAIDKLFLCKRMTVEIDLRCKFYWGGCATVRQSARLRTVLDYLQQCDLKLETHCKVWVALCKRVAYLKVAFSNSKRKRETRNCSRRRRRPGAAAAPPLPAPKQRRRPLTGPQAAAARGSQGRG